MSTPCKILIVEDSIVAAMLISAQINRREPDFEVRICGTWKLAHEMLATFPADIIILDLDLPDSSSEETIAQLPRLALAHKIIATSGDDAWSRECLAAGAHDFMPKAIGEDASQVLNRIAALCPPCSP